MRLYYLNQQGEQQNIPLTEKPLTIGRSADADVLILDEKASRVHCGIRFWDSDFYIKDLKSKNGTFVNDKQIDIHLLQPGDQIRVGASVFVFEHESASSGADTALQEMQGEFEHGKGYSTILREIVSETGSSGQSTGPEEVEDDLSAAPTDPDTPPDGAIMSQEEGSASTANPEKPKKRRIVKKRKLGSSKRSGKAATKKKPLKVKIKRRKAESDS